jgi:hypothetical protein
VLAQEAQVLPDLVADGLHLAPFKLAHRLDGLIRLPQADERPQRRQEAAAQVDVAID